ncbi:MAG: TetR/AcrR family transcriptional regulator [Aminobacterium colombiense]|uniref:Transcriptional regulator, TetR family n=1 Tax=Aminobacterium colombiense (strain DSM 12261 / ALA-1) TaxID=572547 RepID=D5ED14_AMICL|nr:TetR/AcrR family transcriptional regulator [Aminobacterium colombiense]ADE56446.1 transcriptional regulator, TetR family [Aminobacterium colombiense DSM 12261]MDD2379604.1 TetR/AcrR family transcriptional regulator [Aminobacterium colombiense]MDD3768118.1 TetR/AcrR family transcriptional regulator [Aminobacterium colombiense]MDD4265976.1 TetR/AcrR family transcriptional regulator [Aminobacterium colombiense]MDD4586434.1 TetR/AcrR family transcriptional regulator [Aminobacterium colombiense]
MKDSGQDTKALIISIAREHFAEKGFYGTSIDALVKEAGLSKGALYWHFPGKLDLYRAVIKEEVERIRHIMVPEQPEKPEEREGLFIARGEQLIDAVMKDRLWRMFSVHMALESIRGNKEIQDLNRLISLSFVEEFESILMRMYPSLKYGAGGLSLKELIQIFENFIAGLVSNVGTTLSVDEAKRSWKFLVTRVLKGGAPYAP